jgi:hypothetical protein
LKITPAIELPSDAYCNAIVLQCSRDEQDGCYQDARLMPDLGHEHAFSAIMGLHLAASLTAKPEAESQRLEPLDVQ